MIKRVFILVLLTATASAAGAADDATRSKITAQVVSDQTALASDQSTLTLDDVVRTALDYYPNDAVTKLVRTQPCDTAHPIAFGRKSKGRALHKA